eukprot:5243246-Amphidinium_carterae.1
MPWGRERTRRVCVCVRCHAPVVFPKQSSFKLLVVGILHLGFTATSPQIVQSCAIVLPLLLGDLGVVPLVSSKMEVHRQEADNLCIFLSAWPPMQGIYCSTTAPRQGQIYERYTYQLFQLKFYEPLFASP